MMRLPRLCCLGRLNESASGGRGEGRKVQRPWWDALDSFPYCMFWLVVGFQGAHTSHKDPRREVLAMWTSIWQYPIVNLQTGGIYIC